MTCQNSARSESGRSHDRCAQLVRGVSVCTVICRSGARILTNQREDRGPVRICRSVRRISKHLCNHDHDRLIQNSRRSGTDFSRGHINDGAQCLLNLFDRPLSDSVPAFGGLFGAISWPVTADTQPHVQPCFAEIVSDDFPVLHADGFFVFCAPEANCLSSSSMAFHSDSLTRARSQSFATSTISRQRLRYRAVIREGE
jgi:hypothetical protein